MPFSEKEVGGRIHTQRDALAEAITARQYELQPELASRYGEAGREKCRQDARYHLSYLAEALVASSPALFAAYVSWAKVMLATRGIPTTDLARNLECMREVIERSLPHETGAPVRKFIDAGAKPFAGVSHRASHADRRWSASGTGGELPGPAAAG